MNYSFWFLEKLRREGKSHIVKLLLCEGDTFKDPVNGEFQKQNPIFSHCSKIISDGLLLHAAVMKVFK